MVTIVEEETLTLAHYFETQCT